jgi:adenylyltransferase/sulfurtransferase
MKVHIPTPLRQYAEKRDAVDVPAKTVGEALDELIARHPDLRKHLYTNDGKLRSFVNLYLNDEDVRYLAQKEATSVSDNDSLSIVPSIAGGTSGAEARILCNLSARLKSRPLKPYSSGSLNSREYLTDRSHDDYNF